MEYQDLVTHLEYLPHRVNLKIGMYIGEKYVYICIYIYTLATISKKKPESKVLELSTESSNAHAKSESIFTVGI